MSSPSVTLRCFAGSPKVGDDYKTVNANVTITSSKISTPRSDVHRLRAKHFCLILSCIRSFPHCGDSPNAKPRRASYRTVFFLSRRRPNNHRGSEVMHADGRGRSVALLPWDVNS